MIKVGVTAPKNGFVKSVTVKNGGAVIAGQALVVFDDDDEQNDLARIDFHTAVLGALAERLSAPVVQQRLAFIDQSRTALAALLLLKHSYVSSLEGDLRLGIPTVPQEYADAMNDVANATSQAAQMDQQRALVPLLVQIKIDENAETLARLAAQRANVQAKLSHLHVTAPKAGGVSDLLVGPGSFVEVGDPLLTLLT